VDWRRIQSEPELADNKGDAVGMNDGLASVSKVSAGADVAVSCTRKPSERFMRRALQARSKDSASERYRVADLKEKLNELVIDMTNETTVFNGYRPGHGAMPG